MGDGPVADVAAVHGAREADSRHALIGCLQGRLQRRPDRGDGEDPPSAGNHDSILQCGPGMENLQTLVLDLGQAWRSEAQDTIKNTNISMDLFQSLFNPGDTWWSAGLAFSRRISAHQKSKMLKSEQL